MDQKYEFAAPQYVDFNNLAENDNEVDEFFNVDMESGEVWVTATANNTLVESVSTSSEGGVLTHSQCPHFNFQTKKYEIQTKSGPKFQENQTKSGPNLTLFRTGFTKTGLIRTSGQFYRFNATFH